jgi:hypothetical protein
LGVGKYADLAVLSADYMTVPAEDIRQIQSILTMVGGKIVFAQDKFQDLSPALPPASPSWSPVNFEASPAMRQNAPIQTHERACHDGCGNHCGMHGHDHQIAWTRPIPAADKNAFWGALGCSCFAV